MTAKFEILFDIFDSMTVLELSQFTSEYERRYGVSRNLAPAQIIAEKPDEAAAVEEDTRTVELHLVSAGGSKIQVIKLVKELFGLGLADSKTLVDKAPVVLKSGLEKDEAISLGSKFKELGAEVEVR